MDYYTIEIYENKIKKIKKIKNFLEKKFNKWFILRKIFVYNLRIIHLNLMKKRIYSLVEVKSRELNGKILFSIQMANKGYSVVVGKKKIYMNMQNILRRYFFL